MANKRPTKITVICVLGFLGALLTIPIIFSHFAKHVGAWYPPYLAITAIIGLASMFGFWNMKKWGVITYTTLAGLNQLVLMAMGAWNIFALIIPGVIIAIGFSEYQSMD